MSVVVVVLVDEDGRPFYSIKPLFFAIFGLTIQFVSLAGGVEVGGI